MWQSFRQAPRFWFAFLLILVLGISLRAVHFSDWLHFEIDQSYDTLLVSPAVENGISNLPLLGPTAGGGRALRLGPAFYYLEYISGLAFGNTPTGYAMLILLFSILSLPLFYLFVRRYFSATFSLSLLALFSGSLYMVLYSRFSWSPNVLPLLILLTFYALLRSVDASEAHPRRWFVVAAGSLAVTSQIHFNAFFIISAVFGLFLLLKRPHLSLGTWVLATGFFVLLYAPVVVSDIQTNGQNLGFFVKKIAGSSEGGHGSTLEKLAQTLNYTASEPFLILTGLDHINGKKLTGFGWGSATSIPWRAAAILLLLAEIAVLAWNYFTETDPKRRDFLLLALLWFFLGFAYFFSILKDGLNIYPRFFLVESPLVFILFGVLLERITAFFPVRPRIFVPSVIVGVLLITNGLGIARAFQQLATVTTQPLDAFTEDVFPNTARITLAQEQSVANWIASAAQTHRDWPLYLKAKHEYEPVFWYLLGPLGFTYADAFDTKNTYTEGHYFLVAFAGEDLGDTTERFTIARQQDFGTLVAYQLTPKPEAITGERQDPATYTQPVQRRQLDKLFTWKKLLSPSTPGTTDSSSDLPEAE